MPQNLDLANVTQSELVAALNSLDAAIREAATAEEREALKIQRAPLMAEHTYRADPCPAFMAYAPR